MSKKSKEQLKSSDMPIEEEIMQNIKEAYLVKFGNLYVSNKDSKIPDVEHCFSVRYWTGIPKEGISPINIEKLVNCLEKSPQVEKVTFNPKKQKIQWRGLNFDPSIRWHFRPPLRCDLNIPFKNQESAQRKKRMYGDKVEEITKFTVFFDGSNYIITAKVRDIKNLHSVTDVRNLLANLLKKEFRVKELPPNPLREYYYLLFLSDTMQSLKLKPIIQIGPQRRYLLPREEDVKRKDEILHRLLMSCSYFLDTFYTSSEIRANMEYKYVELNKLHMNLQKKSKEFFTAPTLSLLKRRKLKKEIEESILKHYEIILDFNLCMNLIQDAKLEVTRDSKDLFPFYATADKMIEDNFGYYPLNVDLFNACLDYTKKIMERTFSWRLALYAVFFGAISSVLIKYGPDIIALLRDLATSVSS